MELTHEGISSPFKAHNYISAHDHLLITCYVNNVFFPSQALHLSFNQLILNYTLCTHTVHVNASTPNLSASGLAINA